MKETLKSIGSFALGICILVGAIFLIAMFVMGGVWLSEHVYPWLVLIASLAFWITLLIFVPLALFGRTRSFAGGGIYIASFIFGLTLWVWSLLISYTLWGIVSVAFGMILMGGGVVPIAILASLFHGLWSTFGGLVLLTAVTFGSRFLGLYIARKADDPGVAVNDAFSAASDSYDIANDAIESYSTRANHHFAIIIARYDLDKTNDADAYDERVAVFTGPADFAPYTEAYLDAHTAAMETLATAFDRLTAAFADFNPANNLYASAAALYKASSDRYTYAANAYSKAASCAMTSALKGNIQAAKDEFEVGLLEDRAAHAADVLTAKSKAAAFKAKAAENAANAKVLERKARVAETKAQGFVAKAQDAEAKAEEAIRTRQ